MLKFDDECPRMTWLHSGKHGVIVGRWKNLISRINKCGGELPIGPRINLKSKIIKHLRTS